jgi:hypothetical protein
MYRADRNEIWLMRTSGHIALFGFQQLQPGSNATAHAARTTASLYAAKPPEQATKRCVALDLFRKRLEALHSMRYTAYLTNAHFDLQCYHQRDRRDA